MKLVMPGKAVDGLSHLGVLVGLNQADRQTGSSNWENVLSLPSLVAPGMLEVEVCLP